MQIPYGKIATVGSGILLGSIPSLLGIMGAQSGTQYAGIVAATAALGLLVGGKDSGTFGRGIMYGSIAGPSVLLLAAGADKALNAISPGAKTAGFGHERLLKAAKGL